MQTKLSRWQDKHPAARPDRLVLAILVAVLLLAGQRVAALVPQFAAWIHGLGALGPAIFIAGYAVAVAAFVPASVLTLAAGAIFGLGAGVVYVFVAATAGAALGFLISRHLARGAVEKWLQKDARLAAVDRAVAAEGRKIAFLLRLSPAIPFTLLNYALGLTRISFGDFLLACFGMLPATFLYVYYGKVAGEVANLAAGGAPARGVADYTLLVVGLLATLVATVIVTRAARRALQHATGDDRATAPDPKTSAAGIAIPDFTVVDEHDRRLLANVRPAHWSNPQPSQRYNLVVIGAGAGGLVSAAIGAGVGGKVALIERGLMGGDCLNTGCVPSKTLLAAARRLAEARAVVGADALDQERLEHEFAAAMQTVRRVRADLSGEDSARRYRDELGVDVFRGSARFVAGDAVEVDGKVLRFAKAVVATGARPLVPAVPGLTEAGVLTSETVFSLTRRPRRLAVVGGGPIGCELAQAMGRFGCEVTLLERAERLLPRDDAEAGEILQRKFAHEGIALVLGATIESASSGPEGKTLHYRCGAGDAGSRTRGRVTVDEILVAAGRRPDLAGLEPGSAGIDYDQGGIRIDDRLRTTNPSVFAVGDCCMSWQFTHAADAAARIVVRNALFLGRQKLSALTIPWCTYTDPEVAHVGLGAEEARARGIEIDTFRVALDTVHRAVCEGRPDGFVKVHTRKGSDRIVGATIVAAHAGETISEITLAITNDVGLSALASVVHPYPTQAAAIRTAADAYMRGRLTPAAKKALGTWLRWTRKGR